MACQLEMPALVGGVTVLGGRGRWTQGLHFGDWRRRYTLEWPRVRSMADMLYPPRSHVPMVPRRLMHTRHLMRRGESAAGPDGAGAASAVVHHHDALAAVSARPVAGAGHAVPVLGMLCSLGSQHLPAARPQSRDDYAVLPVTVARPSARSAGCQRYDRSVQQPPPCPSLLPHRCGNPGQVSGVQQAARPYLSGSEF